jgi:hypothetical protein
VQGSELEGAVVLTNVGGFRNDGTISLDSTNPWRLLTLAMHSGRRYQFIVGIINIESGTGGQREIDADLINLGRINVNNVLTINSPSGGITNAGELKSLPINFWWSRATMYKRRAVRSKSSCRTGIQFEHEALNVAGLPNSTACSNLPSAGFTPSPNATLCCCVVKRVGFFNGAVVPPCPIHRPGKSIIVTRMSR